MSHCTAPLDADVLHPAPTRDAFPQLAATDVFQAPRARDRFGLADMCSVLSPVVGPAIRRRSGPALSG